MQPGAIIDSRVESTLPIRARVGASQRIGGDFSDVSKQKICTSLRKQSWMFLCDLCINNDRLSIFVNSAG